jgi:hypothetical protein
MTDETNANPGPVPEPAVGPEARAAELELRLAELEATTTARLIRAELKTEAVRAGMVDLDGLKLIDITSLKLDDEGNLAGAAEVMRQMRRAKPWLFGGGASTSSTSAAPPTTPPRPKLATEMTDDEWRAARAELLKRA